MYATICVFQIESYRIMKSDEKLIVEHLRQGEEQAYQYLFDHHYAVMCHVAENYVHDGFLAETIVGDIFFHIWQIRSTLNINSSLRHYLLQSVRNRCLDYLKSRYAQYEEHHPTQQLVNLSVARCIDNEDYPLGRLLEQELEEKISDAIARLPQMCGKVFTMSRFEGLSNEEIATQLGLSTNTVKYHISHALSILRSDLRDYLPFLITLMIVG